MKRCPQCLFIYPESDKRCDFDNTPLVVVDEAELEAATNPASAKNTATAGGRQRKLLAVAAVIGLVLAAIVFAAYSFSRRSQKTAAIQSPIGVSAEPPANPEATPEPAPPPLSPAEVASPSPSPSPVATPKSSPQRLATSHSSTTVAPVSTSGPGIGKRQGGQSIILLTGGGKIDADEVWRTRDGVWYRRDGIVTLLKRNRVKAIVNH